MSYATDNQIMDLRDGPIITSLLHGFTSIKSDIKSALIDMQQSQNKGEAPSLRRTEHSPVVEKRTFKAADVCQTIRSLVSATKDQPPTHEEEEEKAQHLIGDIVRLVDVAFAQASINTGNTNSTGPDISSLHAVAHEQRDIQRLRSMIAVHATVDVNRRSKLDWMRESYASCMDIVTNSMLRISRQSCF